MRSLNGLTFDIDSYLPLFDKPGRQFVKQWSGGEKLTDRSISMPYPVYEEDVDEFFRLASQSCWLDSNYNPETAGQMLEDDRIMGTADLGRIRTMLTFCVRGERFCDGHREALLKSGRLIALLRRLREVREAL